MSSRLVLHQLKRHAGPAGGVAASRPVSTIAARLMNHTKSAPASNKPLGRCTCVSCGPNCSCLSCQPYCRCVGDSRSLSTAAHPVGCGCGSCKSDHGPGCACGSCSVLAVADHHGPLCACVSCQSAHGFLGVSMGAFAHPEGCSCRLCKADRHGSDCACASCKPVASTQSFSHPAGCVCSSCMAERHGASCTCMSCKSAMSMGAFSHPEGCGCRLCTTSVLHDPNCTCGACTAKPHGAGCACASCKPARVSLGTSMRGFSGKLNISFQQQQRWMSSEAKAEEPKAEEPDTEEEKAEEPEGGEAAGEETAEEEAPPEKTKEEMLEDQVRDLKDQLIRSYADQENTRKIAARDVDSAKQFAIKSFAKSLLDVSDNLSRALESVPEDARKDNDVLKTLFEGIEMTDRGLSKAFEMNGLHRFGQIGELFDPSKHNALFEYPDPDKKPGTVGQLVKPGYLLHKRVLRPAEVGVVKEES